MKKISKNKVSFRGLFKWVIHSFLSRNIGKNVLEKVVITVVTEDYPKTDLTLFNLKHKSKPIDK